MQCWVLMSFRPYYHKRHSGLCRKSSIEIRSAPCMNIQIAAHISRWAMSKKQNQMPAEILRIWMLTLATRNPIPASVYPLTTDLFLKYIRVSSGSTTSSSPNAECISTARNHRVTKTMERAAASSATLIQLSNRIPPGFQERTRPQDQTCSNAETAIMPSTQPGVLNTCGSWCIKA